MAGRAAAWPGERKACFRASPQGAGPSRLPAMSRHPQHRFSGPCNAATYYLIYSRRRTANYSGIITVFSGIIASASLKVRQKRYNQARYGLRFSERYSWGEGVPPPPVSPGTGGIPHTPFPPPCPRGWSFQGAPVGGHPQYPSRNLSDRGIPPTPLWKNFV